MVLTSTNRDQRLCSDCRQDVLEWHAAKVCPSYDPAQWQEWETLWRILARLYCVPQSSLMEW